MALSIHVNFLTIFCAHRQEAARKLSAVLPGLHVKRGNTIPTI